jgi:hypothetical protein
MSATVHYVSGTAQWNERVHSYILLHGLFNQLETNRNHNSVRPPSTNWLALNPRISGEYREKRTSQRRLKVRQVLFVSVLHVNQTTCMRPVDYCLPRICGIKNDISVRSDQFTYSIRSCGSCYRRIDNVLNVKISSQYLNAWKLPFPPNRTLSHPIHTPLMVTACISCRPQRRHTTNRPPSITVSGHQLQLRLAVWSQYHCLPLKPRR